jgi:predicted nucleic acid-binding protein
MAVSVIVDAGFLAALIERRERYHDWAVTTAARHPRPWHTSEPVLSEAFFLLDRHGAVALLALLKRDQLLTPFRFSEEKQAVVTLMRKYQDVPMSFADACLVRMTELLADPVVLTTDSHFRVYRRNGRQVVPCALPG